MAVLVQVWICSPIPAMRAGISALIAGDAEFVVAGTAGSAAELSITANAPCVVIATPGGIDLGAGDFPAEAALLLVGGELSEFSPGADFPYHLAAGPGIGPAAATSADATGAGVAENLEGRAWGLLSTESTAEALHAAVRALSEGLVVLSPDGLRELLHPPQELVPRLPADNRQAGRAGDVERLTEREIEVLRLLSQGMTNKQAALALGISEHTVKFHVSSIYAKLGVTNRAEAVRNGARSGWIAL